MLQRIFTQYIAETKPIWLVFECSSKLHLSFLYTINPFNNVFTRINHGFKRQLSSLLDSVRCQRKHDQYAWHSQMWFCPGGRTLLFLEVSEIFCFFEQERAILWRRNNDKRHPHSQRHSCRNSNLRNGTRSGKLGKSREVQTRKVTALLVDAEPDWFLI